MDYRQALGEAAAGLAAQGVRQLLVLPADLPTLTASDVRRLIEGHHGGLSLCPAARDGGTNALLLSPPTAIPFLYGPDSANGIWQAARTVGIAARHTELAGFARDIDTPDDVYWLLEQRIACATLAWLSSSGIRDRLRRNRRTRILENAGSHTSATCGTAQARCIAAAGIDELPQQALRDAGHGDLVTYSRKVFIPLTELCRDVCHYCTYAKTPTAAANVYLSPEQVLDIARAGQAAGCHEALFTLGDKPELRYRAARDALATLGFASTLDYLRAMAELVRRETGLLPHLNAGVMSHEEFRSLREVAPSMGIMLESASAPRLAQKRRSALRLTRQGTGRAPAVDTRCRSGARTTHDRPADRHR
jgi:FO synthase